MSDVNIKDFPRALQSQLALTEEQLDLFQKETKDVNVTMFLSEFENRFLPALMDSPNSADGVRVWWDRVGTPYKGITVLNADTNSVEFQVPPLLRPHSGVKSIDTKGESMSDIVATAGKKSEVIPAIGDRYISEKLTSKIKPIDPNPNDMISWNKILVRFGYDPIIPDEEMSAVEKKQVTSNKTNVEFDDDEFEEL